MKPIDYAKLSEPFAPWEIEWRAGSVYQDKRATLLAYLTARAVMDRLDEVVGPDRWQDSYEQGPGGGIVCTISVLTEHGWVSKCDGAENTKIEAIKGGLSDAYKRSAVKWGIGRYLYRLDANWHDIRNGYPPKSGQNSNGIRISNKGRHVGWMPRPELPSWALPAQGKAEAAPTQTQQEPPGPQGMAATPDTAGSQEPAESHTEPPAEGRHESWADDRKGFMGRLNELLSLQLGMVAPGAYVQLKQLCADKGLPKPSAQSQEQRNKLLSWLSASLTDPENTAVAPYFMPY